MNSIGLGEVAPPSMFDNAPPNEDSDREDTMGDWFYEDVRSAQSEKEGEEKGRRRRGDANL